MDPLKDPKNDRKVKSVKPPPHKPLDTAMLFPGNKGKLKIIQEFPIGHCSSSTCTTKAA
jgi:serine/threonine-protein phosphatase 2B catalytic subunit